MVADIKRVNAIVGNYQLTATPDKCFVKIGTEKLASGPV
jgi:hypothetical protein